MAREGSFATVFGSTNEGNRRRGSVWIVSYGVGGIGPFLWDVNGWRWILSLWHISGHSYTATGCRLFFVLILCSALFLFSVRVVCWLLVCSLHCHYITQRLRRECKILLFWVLIVLNFVKASSSAWLLGTRKQCMSVSALKEAVRVELARTLRLSWVDSDTAIELAFYGLWLRLSRLQRYMGFIMVLVSYLSGGTKCTLLYSEKSPSHDHSAAIRCIFKSTWGVLIHRQFNLDQVKPVAII